MSIQRYDFQVVGSSGTEGSVGLVVSGNATIDEIVAIHSVVSAVHKKESAAEALKDVEAAQLKAGL